MPTEKQNTIESTTRSVIAGFLAVFVIVILLDLLPYRDVFLTALFVIALALLLAKKTAGHFHDKHTHTGDSPIDVVAVSVLVLANTLHPAVDGFALHAVFSEKGWIPGAIFLGGIIVHESFRQVALITVFKGMGIRWHYVVTTGVLGIILGFSTGVLGSQLLHHHEKTIDILTVFAYTFIVGECFFFKNNKTSKPLRFIAVGLIIGTLLTFFVRVH